MSAYIKERVETGRIYLMNIDHSNEHSPWLDKVNMTNLCLRWDSKVSAVVDGAPMTISLKELDDLFKSGKKISVLSKNTETNAIEYKKVTSSGMTGRRKTLRIEDSETGNYIECTPEHEIWTKNRGYVKAVDLKSDDVLDFA
jgi:hypothetical protein